VLFSFFFFLSFFFLSFLGAGRLGMTTPMKTRTNADFVIVDDL